MPTYLYHFSEDPTITRFEPRVAPTQQVQGTFVWACDDQLAPSYWFPRQCPRGTWWPKRGEGRRVHAIQWDWRDRFVGGEVSAYRLDAAPFKPNPGGGGWITHATVTPLDVAPVGPLLDKHRDAGIELRVVPDLKTLWNDVITRPDINFSGIRLRNLDA